MFRRSVSVAAAWAVAAALVWRPGPAAASQLTVTSKPSGAKVTVNGKEVGETPINVDLPATEVKQCEVVISKEGFQAVHIAFTLVPEKFEGLHFFLVPIGGESKAGPPTTPTAPAAPPPTAPPVATPPVAATEPPPSENLPPPGHEALSAWLRRLVDALGLTK